MQHDQRRIGQASSIFQDPGQRSLVLLDFEAAGMASASGLKISKCDVGVRVWRQNQCHDVNDHQKDAF